MITHQYNNEWIMENYLDYSSYEQLAIDHNKIFNTSITTSAIKAHCRKMGLKKPKWYEEFSKEQKGWLQENYHLLGVRETQKQFNEKFGASRTISSIKNYCCNNCRNVNKDVATKNKLKELHYNPDSKRSIKKVGSMRKECGRWVVKKEDGTWCPASRAMYEAEYGEIPEGYTVMFLDNDLNNLCADNLLAVPREYLGLLSRYNLRSINKDITTTGVRWCDLYTTLKDSI